METTASEYLCAAECRAALRQQIRRALEAGPLNEIEIARACCYDPVDGHGRVVLRRVLRWPPAWKPSPPVRSVSTPPCVT
jgi:hypothetical protein